MKNFRRKFLNHKKLAIAITLVLLVFAFSQTGLSARIPLPSWLPEALRDFFQRHPDFTMEPYKNGTIILVKPVATGVGDGAYQAGDIVEIRDGASPLSMDERTKLLPLYYPGKIDEKLKQELMRPMEDSSSPQMRGGQGGVLNENTTTPNPSSTEEGRKILARRAYGIDYTKFLSATDILKARRFEPLKSLPEIDLKAIINKQNGLSFGDSSDKIVTTGSPISNFQFPIFPAMRDPARRDNQLSNDPIFNENLSPPAGGENSMKIAKLKIENSIVHLPWYLSVAEKTNFSSPPQLRRGIKGEVVFDFLQHLTPTLSSSEERGQNATSVVYLPWYLSFIEKSYNAVSWLAQSLSKPAFATGESVKVVDPGAGTGYNYLSLNTWEAAEQADLTAAGTNVIAVAKCRATGGKADTTAVIVDGWTTDATHYIKVWTDPSESFRHSGKWDDGKYVLSTAVSGAAIYSTEENVWIEGLQIYYSYLYGSYGIEFNAAGQTNIKIDQNIIRGPNSGASYGIYFFDQGTGSVAKSWNNIIYNNRFGYGFRNYNSSNHPVSLYIYNNTIYDSNGGIVTNTGGSIIAKNNLVASTTDPFILYGGVFAAGTDYNATDINDTPGVGSNNRINQVFYFTDSANADFRLAEADTGAKGAGTPLYADTDIAVTTDIENQARPAQGGFDIGADQFVATQIYRSVGPSNTTALASGASNAMTISGALATFASALPANVGVGDVIQYATSSGTVNSLAFISGRTSPTSYTVYDVAGRIASSTTANTGWSIFRAYTSLYNAVGDGAGTENTGINSGLRNFDTWSGGKNLASSTQVWNVACYGDAVDTTAVYVNGWTTATSTYMRIYTPYLTSEVGASQRHQGKWTTSAYRLETSGLGSGYASLYFYANNIKIDGLQIFDSSTNDYVYGIYNNANAVLTGSWAYISNSIIKGRYTGSANGHIAYMESTGVKTSYLSNLIIYDFKNGTQTNMKGISFASGNVAYIYNVTVYNSYIGFDPNYQTVTIKNSLAQGCNDGFNTNGMIFTAASDYNISDVASDAPGTHSKNGVRVNFVDAAHQDFHLAVSDVWARNKGVNLSADANLAFATDIDGQCRQGGSQSSTGVSGCGGLTSTASAWDIGADEVVSETETNKPQTNLLNSGLVGYWSFDGSATNWTSATAGTTNDLSGHYATGTMTNMSRAKSPVPGISGQALSFDGVNSYVQGTNATFSGDFSGSYCAWVKLNSVSSSQGIISQGNANTYQGFGMFVGARGTGVISAEFYGNRPVQTNNILSANSWNYICITKSPGYINSTTLSIYLNGLPQTTSNSYGIAPNFVGSYPVYIGVDVVSNGSPLSLANGLLDEVRVYNRALSPSEITQLYNAGASKLKINTSEGNSSPLGLTGSSNGLVGNWTFNGQDMGTTSARDLSGNNNTGWLLNGPKKVAGISGQALSFDGVDDKVNTGNFNIGNTSWSISVWVKYDGTTADHYFLGQLSGSGSSIWELEIYNKRIDFATYASGWVSGLGVIPANVWNHIVITGTPTNTSLYLNGVLDRGNGAAPSDISSNNVRIEMGWAANYGAYFNGSLDEVRVYNRALSASEIQQLYQEQSGKAKFKKY